MVEENDVARRESLNDPAVERDDIGNKHESKDGPPLESDQGDQQLKEFKEGGYGWSRLCSLFEQLKDSNRMM